jgi:hypothetical protein
MSLDRRQLALGTALAVGVVAAPAAACGSDDGLDAERERVRTIVKRLYDAMQRRDAEAVCAHLNVAARRQVAGDAGSCAQALSGLWRAVLPGRRTTLEPTIRAIAIDGSEASVTLSFGPGSTARIPLAKGDEGWKLDRTDTSPLMWVRDEGRLGNPFATSPRI